MTGAISQMMILEPVQDSPRADKGEKRTASDGKNKHFQKSGVKLEANVE